MMHTTNILRTGYNRFHRDHFPVRGGLLAQQ
jgi:hypothetical protein